MWHNMLIIVALVNALKKFPFQTKEKFGTNLAKY